LTRKVTGGQKTGKIFLGGHLSLPRRGNADSGRAGGLASIRYLVALGARGAAAGTGHGPGAAFRPGYFLAAGNA